MKIILCASWIFPSNLNLPSACALNMPITRASIRKTKITSYQLQSNPNNMLEDCQDQEIILSEEVPLKYSKGWNLSREEAQGMRLKCWEKIWNFPIESRCSICGRRRWLTKIWRPISGTTTSEAETGAGKEIGKEKGGSSLEEYQEDSISIVTNSPQAIACTAAWETAKVSPRPDSSQWSKKR